MSDHKTEPASAIRILAARRAGIVPRSSVLPIALSLLLMGAYAWVMLPQIWQRSAFAFSEYLRTLPQALNGMDASQNAATGFVTLALTAVLPILLMLVLIPLLLSMVVGGANFTLRAVALDFSRNGPFAGAQRLFSMNAAAEALKALWQVVTVVLVFSAWLWHERGVFSHLPPQDLSSAVATLSLLLAKAMIIMGLSCALLAIVDVVWVMQRYQRALMMSRHEAQREQDAAQGKGADKSARRSLYRKLMASRPQPAAKVLPNPVTKLLIVKPGFGAVQLMLAANGRAPIIAGYLAETEVSAAAPKVIDASCFDALQGFSIGSAVPASLHSRIASLWAECFAN